MGRTPLCIVHGISWLFRWRPCFLFKMWKYYASIFLYYVEYITLMTKMGNWILHYWQNSLHIFFVPWGRACGAENVFIMKGYSELKCIFQQCGKLPLLWHRGVGFAKALPTIMITAAGDCLGRSCVKPVVFYCQDMDGGTTKHLRGGFRSTGRNIQGNLLYLHHGSIVYFLVYLNGPWASEKMQ